MSGERTGGCLCGAVRYVAALDAEHQHLHACHCTMCRRVSGGVAFSVMVPAAAMRVNGAEHVTTYASSDWAARSFCARCGSGLWYRLTQPDAATADYYLSAGTLDDPNGLPLTREIYIDTKPDGFAFAGDHSRLTGAEFEASLQANPEE
ncbi:MAG: aldehyde-activating protein [Rhodobacteraceae bacterium GWE1_64_9]|nr:MAG: aldehyde-activating protein [Rhodobacteraceae bacterium GWE1_64_9]OHC50162.1 MAG: aldehyde-activating protein [Rhodobacteraceae bacterium GWF1_65_7]HBD89482.1 aldehyde-activating protein [Gemmobacter sp.]HBU14851.1 aldehyde-activating protein [Gemmobacter sp.]